MELVQFLNYIFAVSAALLAGFALHQVLELDRKVTFAYY